jgi:hypothetical protein
MLCIIKNDGADGVFQPEVLRVLVVAFEEAWQQLEKRGIRFASNYQREQARNTLGKYIIQKALKGERDKDRLCEESLASYGQLPPSE